MEPPPSYDEALGMVVGPGQRIQQYSVEGEPLGGGKLSYVNTVELQWLEHRWLIYFGYFGLVLGSLGKKSHSCRHYHICDNLG